MNILEYFGRPATEWLNTLRNSVNALEERVKVLEERVKVLEDARVPNHNRDHACIEQHREQIKMLHDQLKKLDPTWDDRPEWERERDEFPFPACNELLKRDLGVDLER